MKSLPAASPHTQRAEQTANSRLAETPPTRLLNTQRNCPNASRRAERPFSITTNVCGIPALPHFWSTNRFKFKFSLLSRPAGNRGGKFKETQLTAATKHRVPGLLTLFISPGYLNETSKSPFAKLKRLFLAHPGSLKFPQSTDLLTIPPKHGATTTASKSFTAGAFSPQQTLSTPAT